MHINHEWLKRANGVRTNEWYVNTNCNSRDEFNKSRFSNSEYYERQSQLQDYETLFLEIYELSEISNSIWRFVYRSEATIMSKVWNYLKNIITD